MQDNADRLPADLAPRLRRVPTALHFGWSKAAGWMRMQARCDLARERRRRAAA